MGENMNGVLGGFKNMLASWRRNLRIKKNKEKMQHKKQKRKSFFYSFLAILYFPIGVLFGKDSSKKEEKINKEIEVLDKKIKSSTNNLEINYSEEQLEKIKVKVENTDNKVIQSKIKQLENNILNKKEELKLENTFKNNLDNKKTTSINQSNIENNMTVKPSYEKSQVILKDNVDDFKLEINFIKSTTSKIKEDLEEIKKIEEKNEKIKYYNELYELEHKLKELLKEYEDLKKEYKFMSKNFNFEIEDYIDKYELIKNDKKLDEVIEIIKKDIKLVEEKKDLIFYQKNKASVEVKKDEEKAKHEDKKEIKKEKKEAKEIDEFVFAKEIILKNIINQNQYLDKYIENLSKSTNKKKTLFTSLNGFSNMILRFSISLLPFKMFKNKLISTLVSSVMINNSIKTMRKMIKPQLNINYEILEEYYKSKNIIQSIHSILLSSLNDLEMLKNDLILLDVEKYEPKLLKQVFQLESNIINQIEKLNVKNKNLDKIYRKIKRNFI